MSCAGATLDAAIVATTNVVARTRTARRARIGRFCQTRGRGARSSARRGSTRALFRGACYSVRR
jgi:hypothetical protein